ncbi:unnamed protein product [Phaedon cochleariae]|uniref:PH domain-containing protein n=1 Tax=Phaedon cochleariae TaxID=80249 RepID=A0A9P0GIB4_PHACE|nr:unnamed protein product [Phaedon cochleariae]
MDAFTENILARARERQKLLEDYTGSEKSPLRETQSNNSSKTNLADTRKVHKASLSDSDLTSKIKRAGSSPFKENNSDSNLPRFSRQNSKTMVSSEIPGSPGSQLKTLNIQQDNFNMEIKLTSTENVRVEVEIAEADSNSDSENNHDENGLRDESKSKLKRLGRLYAGGEEADISSPIHKTEAKFCTNECSNSDQSKTKSEKLAKSSRKGLSKLADLAQTINQWEDDVSTPRHVEEKVTSPKKTWKPPAPQPPVTVSPPKPVPTKISQKPKAPEPPIFRANSPDKGDLRGSPTKQVVTPRKDDRIQVVDAVPKKLKWDKNVLDTLESQGFTRTNSESRLVYSYNSQDKNIEVRTAQKVPVTKEQPNVIPEEEEIPTEGKIKQLKSVLEAKTSNDQKLPQAPSSPTKLSVRISKNEEGTKYPSKSNLRSGNIAGRAAIFETSPSKSTKDPALLSVSERMALFEKNRGEALVPKAAFGMAPPVKVETTTKASATRIFAEKTNKPSEVRHLETVKPIIHSPPKSAKKPAPKPPVETSTPTVAAVQQAGGIANKMAALLQNKTTISQEQIESSVKSERQKEMDMLLNRFNKNKAVVNDAIVKDTDDDEEDGTEVDEKTAMISGSVAQIVNAGNRRKSAEKRKSGGKPHGKGDSPQVAAVLNEVKRIKVTGPKPGALYPNLSDIEATTETETDNHTRSPSPDEGQSSFEDNNDSDDPNTSFGRDILEAVCKNQTPQKRPIYDESTASDVSSILDDMDNYLGEYSNGENSSTGPTPPKQVKPLVVEKTTTHPSNSFNYKTFSPTVKPEGNKFQSPMKTRTSVEPIPDLPEYVVEGDNVLPLTHTVSFYRKQQNQAQTPVRQISRQPQIEESAEEPNDEDILVTKKMDDLKGEVSKQQNIISQTSQALNLCSCTPEFSGSTEQVEAERVLLVATHRRQAALHEIQRLKVEGTIRPQGQHAKDLPLEKGTLTISNIILPLKHKYVKALAAAGGKGHHVVCLIKCGEQVVPTKLVSTVIHNAKNPDTELRIPGTVILKDIYSDFTVTFEVYCLQAQEEFLPHEVKYHINNKKSGSKLVTPKKSKQDSRMIMPIKESPGGPQAVRTSSFAVMGYVVFSVQAVNKRVWSLNNTPSMSPLEGSVEMRICCELAVSVEHRGFLTMFEDVSGFGAWHRRWCLLKGHTLSYWKYPDDEKKMAPIDSINLKSCVTKQVEPVSREICARLHTFLIERERLARPQDKDSLVTICQGNTTIIRHLLSADTKEERIEWCEKFNSAFTALRMWGNTQQ